MLSKSDHFFWAMITYISRINFRNFLGLIHSQESKHSSYNIDSVLQWIISQKNVHFFLAICSTPHDLCQSRTAQFWRHKTCGEHDKKAGVPGAHRRKPDTFLFSRAAPVYYSSLVRGSSLFARRCVFTTYLVPCPWQIVVCTRKQESRVLVEKQNIVCHYQMDSDSQGESKMMIFSVRIGKKY